MLGTDALDIPQVDTEHLLSKHEEIGSAPALAVQQTGLSVLGLVTLGTKRSRAGEEVKTRGCPGKRDGR